MLGFTLAPRPAVILVYAHPTDARKLRKRVLPVRDHAQLLTLAPSELAAKLVASARPALDGADRPQLELLAARLGEQIRKATAGLAARPVAPLGHALTSRNASAAPAVTPPDAPTSAATVAPTPASSAPLNRDLLREVEDMLSEESDDDGTPWGAPTPASTLAAPTAGRRAGGGASAFPDALDSLSKTAPAVTPAMAALDVGAGLGRSLGVNPRRVEPTAPAPLDLRAPSNPRPVDALDALSGLSTRHKPLVFESKPAGAKALAKSDSIESIGSVESFGWDSPASPAPARPATAPAVKDKRPAGGKADPLAALLGLSDSDDADEGLGKYGAAAARRVAGSATTSGRRTVGWNLP
jgi:hypothetical protein